MVSEEQQHSSDENNAFRGGSDLSQIKQVRLVQPDRRQLSWTMLDVERLVDEDHPVRSCMAPVNSRIARWPFVTE